MANNPIQENTYNSMPKVNVARSTFQPSPKHLTTLDASWIVPIKMIDCIPSSSYRIDLSALLRMETLLKPIFGNIWIDLYAFYVPYELLDEKFEKMIGEGHDNSFSETLYGEGGHTPNKASIGRSINPSLFVPKMTHTSESFVCDEHSLANYLGIPLGSYDFTDEDSTPISAYPFRAYNLIYNTYFRSPFLQDPLLVDFGNSTSDFANYELKKACRNIDLMSGSFVSPEVFDDISIGLSGLADLVGDASLTDLELLSIREGREDGSPITLDLHGIGNKKFYGYGDGDSIRFPSSSAEYVSPISGIHPYNSSSFLKAYLYNGDTAISLDNVKADLKTASSITLNQLRNAFVLQHISEKALYGTDLESILLSSFGETFPKYQLKKPLFIGGKRQPISVAQITQTSGDIVASENESTLLTTPLGSTAGQSVTGFSLGRGKENDSFYFQSYTFGIAMVVAVIRHESVYDRGIDPILRKHDRFDFYWPELTQVGYVGIPESMIWFTGELDNDNLTFGFNEYAYDIRYPMNRVSGYFATNSQYSLKNWHLADEYNEAPNLGEDWIEDTTETVLSRCLALAPEDQTNSPQFLAYFSFNITETVPLPIHSIPGLTRL